MRRPLTQPRARRLGVVVVGQTPPPFHGQAVMIEALLRGSYDQIVVHHVRMAFSREIDEIGTLTLGKVTHLFGLVARIAYARLRFRAPILYYPPAGPRLIPVGRDIVVLLLTRWMFRRVVFHFHAAGVSELRGLLSAPFRWLYDRAYGRPDMAIALSDVSPPDGTRLQARRIKVVPYGIEDRAAALVPQVEAKSCGERILYVGAIRRSKGILVLLEAFANLAREFDSAQLVLVGQFRSPVFQEEVAELLGRLRIAGRVLLPGEMTGTDKDQAFLHASVFCYPTYFEAESLPVAVLEAMNFALPVVATRWRGIPSLIEDGITGLLVPPRDSQAILDGLRRMLADPPAARRMGHLGRERYLAHHTLRQYRHGVEQAICSADERS